MRAAFADNGPTFRTLPHGNSAPPQGVRNSVDSLLQTARIVHDALTAQTHGRRSKKGPLRSMADTTFKTAGKELKAAFLEFDRGLRVRQATLAYALGLLLIPTGWMLDYFVYPSLLWPNLKIRLICDA